MARKAAPKKAKKRAPRKAAKKRAPAKKAPKKRKRELTPKQQRFVDEYLVDLDATKAAKRSGYSEKSAMYLGYQLLQNPLVAAQVAKKGQAQQERTQITADVVLGELLRLARADVGQAFDADGNLLPIHEMPEDIRRALSGVEVEELFEGRGHGRERVGNVRKVKFWDKARALEMLGKHLALFVDRVRVDDADAVLERLLGVSREELPS